ncbi:Dipeptidase [Alteribacillus persepolensis]|uniref:Dipeptidase n=1 Tax=Alteribacillus persepolensis TaxID=568899 RepID=A0A1G8EVB2_9BACI|nr:C69 family dipeptidase [Alteribacillus persepolensis]SDH73649.1 Dipeptidase [Alteribacillus persepolensis]
MSIGFFVGKNLTSDGSTLLGGFGHEPSSHWIDIVPAQQHPRGSTIQVGVTENADLPGELIDIPQVPYTNKYISSTYSEFAGFPPPLTNGGLNEHGVAGRDIWSPSRSELVEMTPEPQRGLNYSDLARIAMERAATAREAVEITGELINTYGFATYGGNSHLFADKDEGWVMIEYAGGQGLWAAERLGPDDVRVSYPGYIHHFPVDFQNNDNYMGSDNIIEFAREQGWWNPDTDHPDYMNLQDVYGEPFPGEGVDKADDHFTAVRVPPEREEELKAMAPVSLEDMLALVRDPRWSNDRSGYGQVAHLRPHVPNSLQTLWLAVTGAVTTPYVPIPIAADPCAVPPEFVQHRYMTKYADSEFLSSNYAPQEATRYATREFKRLMYFTSEHPVYFLPYVTGMMECFEQMLIAERRAIEEAFLSLMQSGQQDAAIQLISANVHQRLFESLCLGMQLTNTVEMETRRLFGIRMPEDNKKPGETTPPWSQEMIAETIDEMVTCYDPRLDIYPRPHGYYNQYAVCGYYPSMHTGQMFS